MNQKRLRKLLTDYYTKLYLDDLGLKDYKKRVQARLNENKTGGRYDASREIKLIKSLLNNSFKDKKVLVVGAGTGLAMFKLIDQEAKVTVIEPDEKAVEILHLKAKLNKYPEKMIKKAVAENLPFKTGEFDLVYCWQVIEHVQDVEQSIKEMARVVKKNGFIFLGCPDYRQIIEPHYKLFLPMFLPKIIIKLVLKIIGRKTDYFDSLQFVNAKQLKKLFRKNGLTAMQIIKPMSDKLKSAKGTNLVNWIQDNLEIEATQLWLVKKT